MKNTAVLIDTNIVLDILEKREPFYESSKDVLLCCASKKITGYIALHSVSNIFYILRKQYSAEDRRRLILGILDFLQVANAKHENVRHALERNVFILNKIKITCIQIISYVQKCPAKQRGINICIPAIC